MSRLNSPKPNGFILLEVLVATSLVLGVWMTSVGAYQVLVLRLSQQESRRAQLRLVLDAYELARQGHIHSDANTIPNISSKGVKYESSRVPDRNRSFQSIAKPTSASE